MLNDEIKVLVFGLNDEKYSTDIKNVERILGYEEPTILPEVPEFVKGVISYGDGVLPVIDLVKKFKLASTCSQEVEKRIIVVKRQTKKFGIIVDSVYEVRNVDEKIIEDCPIILDTKEQGYIKGLIKLTKEIIILLDLEKILSIKDEEKIF